MKSENLFVLFTMLATFCIGGEYAITRPASQSIFLSVFSASAFPVIWLATVPLNFLVVYLYNRFLPRFGPLRVMGFSLCLTAGINILLTFLLPLYPNLIFFHFCWKDIYILLMFKQLWSMIHSTPLGSRSKILYGVIFSMGTCGSILGSLIPSLWATQLGSETLFLFTTPIYGLLFYAYLRAHRISGIQTFSAPEQPQAKEGISLILRNRYLLGVLLLVVLMQISVAFVEYQFSHQLEISFPEKDLRTAITGKLMSYVSLSSLGLQLVGSFFLLKFIGLRNSHFLIPSLLCCAALGQLFIPGFVMVACAYAFTKAIDFSLFGVLREMLFIPLKLDEKFRAKAVIDIFAYRTSKAMASLLLLGLQAWVGAAIFTLTSYLSIAIFFVWIFVVALLFVKSSESKAQKISTK